MLFDSKLLFFAAAFNWGTFICEGGVMSGEFPFHTGVTTFDVWVEEKEVEPMSVKLKWDVVAKILKNSFGVDYIHVRANRCSCHGRALALLSFFWNISDLKKWSEFNYIFKFAKIKKPHQTLFRILNCTN